MNIFSQIGRLISKEFLLEKRQKYSFYGIILYVGCTVFVCYLSIGLKGNIPAPFTWNALLWIILLFSAVSAITKSFANENKNRNLYYYTLVSPEAIILSKICYNTLMMLFLSFSAYGIYSIVLGNPVQNNSLFCINLALGAAGFSSTFTLVSAISSRAGNSATLMAVLSIPIIIPLLLLLMKLSRNAIDGLDISVSTGALIMLTSINLMVISLSYILFPYLWRG